MPGTSKNTTTIFLVIIGYVITGLIAYYSTVNTGNLERQKNELELNFLKERVAALEATKPELLKDRVQLMRGEIEEVKEGFDEIKELLYEISD